MKLFLRFSFIGIINTGLHFILLVILVEKVNIWPPLANASAFFGANLFSYFANSRFSFGVGINSSRYIRFFTTSLIGMGISYGLSDIVAHLGWHYLFGFALLVVVMPPVNYLLVRRLVFPDA
ncbi:MAG: GtrA family protein [Gallionellaceae bacterium]